MILSKKLLLGVFPIALGIFAFSFFAGEERLIKKRFALLSEYVSKSGEENALTIAQRAKRVGALFADRVYVNIPEEELEGDFTRQEIVIYAAQARLAWATISLRFSDPVISFPKKGVAAVAVRGRVTGKSISGEDVEETRRTKWTLRKVEDQWLFSGVEVMEIPGAK